MKNNIRINIILIVKYLIYQGYSVVDLKARFKELKELKKLNKKLKKWI
jgi:hypothetical protein